MDMPDGSAPPPAPLGAPSDPVRPYRHMTPMPPPADAPAAPSPPPSGGFGIGVALAFGFLLVTWLSLSLFFVPIVPTLLPLGYIIGVHVWAMGSRRTGVIAGFWTTVAILIMIFVVSCFALVLNAVD